jgi:hypothetical protein
MKAPEFIGVQHQNRKSIWAISGNCVKDLTVFGEEKLNLA